MSQEIIALLTNAANEYVDKNLNKGRIPSDWDIGNYLDHWLEQYEREHGDSIDEDDFEDLCNDIGKRLLDDKRVYKWKDWNSYYNLVKSKNKISVQEYNMHKNIIYNTGSNMGSNVSSHRVIYRDTEFEVNKDGYYVKPQK